MDLPEPPRPDRKKFPSPPPQAKNSTMNKWAIAALIMGGLLAFGWISNAVDGDSNGGSSAGSDAVTDSSGDVDWENYAPEVKTRINGLASSGDCDGLQEEFDVADANNDAQLARVGDNNADLMRYIDDKMADAGCYG